MQKVIQIGSETYKLHFDEFDDEVDIDELLKIDYSNLLGEIVTFPVIVNRFGMMLAEAESKLSETKLNMEVLEAKTKERLRVELAEENGGKNPTVEMLNNAFVKTAVYKSMRDKLIKDQKTRDYINSVFWSIRDKSSKINILYKSSEIVEEEDFKMNRMTMNGVQIKKVEKLIK
jgi:hypothetical protein